MKFILILSLILTIAINAQNPNPEINYEKPEIRRNLNPLGDNFNPRIDMVDAPSSVKREYVANNKMRNKLRSEIARGFDLDALRDWILHLGKLNLNMITSQQFITDVASMKGYAKSLDTYINEKYKHVLNQLALIDLKLKEINVLDEETENVKNLEPHHLEHPYWKERLNEIIANSASVNNNFNVGIHGIKGVIQKLNTYLDHLSQTYIDPKNLDYSVEDSLAAQNVDRVQEEEIPSVSTYLSYAGQWLRVNIKPIVSDYLLVDSTGRRNDISNREVAQIAQQVQNVALKNLNKKENVQKIQEIVGDGQIGVQEANAQVAEVVSQTVEEAIQKVNNKKPNNAKVDVEGVAEEVQEKVNQKLDDVTQQEASATTEQTEEASPSEENHNNKKNNNKKNNNKKNNNKKNNSSAVPAEAEGDATTEQTGEASPSEENHNNKKNNNKKNNNKKNNSSAAPAEAEGDATTEQAGEATSGEEHHNNKKNNNKKNNNKKNNNKKNNNKKNNSSAAPAEAEGDATTEQAGEATTSEEHHNNKKNNNKKNNASEAPAEADANAEGAAEAPADAEPNAAEDEASTAEEKKNNNKNKKKENNNKKNKASRRLRYY